MSAEARSTPQPGDRAWLLEAAFVDRAHGSRHHVLTPQNTPAATVRPGEPDACHAVQAFLIPRLPVVPAMAEALRRKLV